jgi:hypothetical protein
VGHTEEGLKFTSIANCCSLAALVNNNAKGILGSYAEGQVPVKDDIDSQLVNISSLYCSGTGDSRERFAKELKDTIEAAKVNSNYFAGAILITNVQIGPMVEVLTAEGWIPLIDFPGGHGGKCTLWFHQIKYLDGKAYNSYSPAKSKRRRRPTPLPEWCEQEKKADL